MIRIVDLDPMRDDEIEAALNSAQTWLYKERTSGMQDVHLITMIRSSPYGRHGELTSTHWRAVFEIR